MDRFDYIVIGGGTAGCVVANRLSQNPDNSVLLLEAGTANRNPLFNIPLVGPAWGVGHPQLDWNYQTEPDETRWGITQNWPRGKMLGGSSRLNGMVHVRGAARDYDGWEAGGCSGWGWRDVAPLFRRMEKVAAADGVHGTDGPLPIHKLHHPHPLSATFVAAHEEQGYRQNTAYNGGNQEGASILFSTNDGHWRSSSVSSYLAPAKGRRNLTVRTGAIVTQVLIEHGKAVGAEYLYQGRSVRVRSTHEIVISAGSINSPAILMRSGIGPADHLRSVGIEPVRDRSGVGQNLHEHPALQIIARSNRPTISSQNRWWHGLKHAADWWFKRGGLLSAASYEAVSFIRSTPEKSHPDMQLHFAPYGLVRTTQGLVPHPDDSFTIQVNLSYPESRGSISLRGRDPHAAPVIHAPMFAAASDLQSLIHGTQWAVGLCKTGGLGKCFDGFIAPDFADESDNMLEQAVLRHAVPAYHPAGTCRMGSDDRAVVDPQLRVKGVESLRIVDASIIPSPISGNIQAAALMIAEKACDLVLNCK